MPASFILQLHRDLLRRHGLRVAAINLTTYNASLILLAPIPTMSAKRVGAGLVVISAVVTIIGAPIAEALIHSLEGACGMSWGSTVDSRPL